MNKAIVIGIAVGIIVIGVALFMTSNPINDSNLPENDSVEESETQTAGRSINLELKESVGITATP